MLRKLKNQKGFTLIEVLVVVIIVAILAAIAVPRYLRYVEKSRSTEAQTAISTIRKAYDIYMQTNGSTDGFTLEMAQKEASLGESTKKNWKIESFHLAVDPHHGVRACGNMKVGRSRLSGKA